MTHTPDPGIKLGRKLKLDLHTHCQEAARFAPVSVRQVEKIVDIVKSRGLDGIATTDHWNREYGEEIKAIADRYFPGEMIVIPGQEIDIGDAHQVVELYLPDGSTFRFFVHPGAPRAWVDTPENIHGIEIDNAIHNWHIAKHRVLEVAAELDLITLRNSDAHYFEDIGRYYNEISIEELCHRARRDGKIS